MTQAIMLGRRCLSQSNDWPAPKRPHNGLTKDARGGRQVVLATRQSREEARNTAETAV